MLCEAGKFQNEPCHWFNLRSTLEWWMEFSNNRIYANANEWYSMRNKRKLKFIEIRILEFNAKWEKSLSNFQSLLLVILKVFISLLSKPQLSTYFRRHCCCVWNIFTTTFPKSIYNDRQSIGFISMERYFGTTERYQSL